MIAYHFISDEYALDVISSQWIKLSLFQDLNDPFELLSVDLPNEQARREARKFKEFMAKQYGILCFSKNWTNPLLWSHYANRHKGVAFQFELNSDIDCENNICERKFKEALSDYEEKMERK